MFSSGVDRKTDHLQSDGPHLRRRKLQKIFLLYELITFYLPGNIFWREGPSGPLSLEEFQRYLTRFHPRRLLELLSKGGDLPPEKSVEASGGSPDVGVVYRVTVNVLVAHCSYAVTALQLVGELPCGSEIET